MRALIEVSDHSLLLGPSSCPPLLGPTLHSPSFILSFFSNSSSFVTLPAVIIVVVAVIESPVLRSIYTVSIFPTVSPPSVTFSASACLSVKGFNVLIVPLYIFNTFFNIVSFYLHQLFIFSIHFQIYTSIFIYGFIYFCIYLLNFVIGCLNPA